MRLKRYMDKKNGSGHARSLPLIISFGLYVKGINRPKDSSVWAKRCRLLPLNHRMIQHMKDSIVWRFHAPFHHLRFHLTMTAK